MTWGGGLRGLSKVILEKMSDDFLNMLIKFVGSIRDPSRSHLGLFLNIFRYLGERGGLRSSHRCNVQALLRTLPVGLVRFHRVSAFPIQLVFTGDPHNYQRASTHLEKD